MAAAICSICTETYKDSVEISSTSCGHVFHSFCLMDWRTRSNNCPQCRQHVQQPKRLFMNFEDDSSESNKKIEKLKIELEETILGSSLLQQQLDDKDRDFLILQAILSKNDEEIKESNNKIDYLTLQNDNRSKEIETKTNENLQLQEALNNFNKEGPCIKLQEEINTLNEKLKQLTLELSKEIRNSTELIVDKMKLQSMLDHTMKTNQQKNEHNEMEQVSQQTRIGESLNSNSNLNLNTNQKPNPGCYQSVVIINIVRSLLADGDFMNYLIKLIKIMNINIKREDIHYISILGRKDLLKVSLLVKFASVNLKLMFLSNKDKLKNSEETKNLRFQEYIWTKSGSLLQEAKVLKRHGYEIIHYKHGRVYVRKDDKSPVIVIRNTKRIEALEKKAAEDNSFTETRSDQNS